MKILVFGTGVIGSTYGYVLAEAGHQVTHLVRPGHGPAGGAIPLRLLDGRQAEPVDVEATYRPGIVETFSPADRYDLILVSVKHYDLLSAVAELPARAGSADILIFNNWWGTFEPIDAELAGRYLWGFPVAGGGWADGVLQAALLGQVQLAEVDGSATPRLAAVARLFEGAGISAERPALMRDWLWIHFATEAGLIASAIEAAGVDALLDSTERLSSAVLAVRDGLEVCRARGVDVEASADAQTFYAPPDMVAAGIAQFYATNVPARRILDRHTGAEELRQIYRDVVATGTGLGVPMPHLLALQAAVEAWDGTVPTGPRTLAAAR